jgi:hypothetical protein
MTTGCTLKAEIEVPFGRGQSGTVKLTVDKDRPGHVRGLGGGRLAGTVNITANSDGTMALEIVPPTGAEAVSNKEETEKKNAEFARERISAYLTRMPDKSDTKNQTELGCGGNVKAHRAAREWMLACGYLSIAKRGQSQVLTLTKRYSSLELLVSGRTSSTSSTPRPSSSLDEDETVAGPTSSKSPTPEGGDEGRPPDGVLDGLDGNEDDVEKLDEVLAADPKLPGGDRIAGLIRACRDAGGKPAWKQGVLVNLSTGEVLA